VVERISALKTLYKTVYLPFPKSLNYDSKSVLLTHKGTSGEGSSLSLSKAALLIWA